MHKLRIRIFILILTLGLFIPAGVMVLKREYDKKVAKAAADVEYFKSLEGDYERYRQEQLAYVQKAIEENKKSMDEAKKSYDTLLAQQPAIIDQHRRQVPVTQRVPTQKIVSSSSGSSGSSKSSSSGSSSSSAPSKPTTTKKTSSS